MIRDCWSSYAPPPPIPPTPHGSSPFSWGVKVYAFSIITHGDYSNVHALIG